jgi:hypothetical protein
MRTFPSGRPALDGTLGRFTVDAATPVVEVKPVSWPVAAVSEANSRSRRCKPMAVATAAMAANIEAVTNQVGRENHLRLGPFGSGAVIAGSSGTGTEFGEAIVWISGRSVTECNQRQH